MSAFVKIPMQFLILLIGVMVFVFYQFVQPPLIFKSDDRAKVEQSAEYQRLNAEYAQAFAARQQAALESRRRRRWRGDARQSFIAANDRLNDVRKRAGDLVKNETGKPFNDVNYVFPTFVTTYAPAGVIGLIIAAIFAAAMSSISAELAALSTATVIDFYRRHFRPEAPDAHYLMVSKLATGFWGVFACVVALVCGKAGVVDRSRQQIRLVFLRLAARRLRARDRNEAGDGQRGVLRLAGGNRHGRAGRQILEDQLSLVQRHRMRCRGGRWNAAEFVWKKIKSFR